MAVQSNNGNEYKSSTKGNGGKKLGKMLFGRHYMLKKVTKMIFTVLFVGLFIAALFGFINQRATGESIADWATRTGGEIGEAIMAIFTGDDDAPLSIGSEGVYIDGYQPEEQEEFADTFGGNESNNQEEQANE